MTGSGRALVGAVLLNLAVSPLFVWGSFRDRLASDLSSNGRALDLAYAVGLGAFTLGVLIGGRVTDRLAPRTLALVVAAGLVPGLALVAVAESVLTVVLGYGVLLGVATGLGYATAVRVAAVATSRRGSALALVVSAYAAGAVALAPIVEAGWEREGRATTMGTLAGVLGALVLLAAIALPNHAPPLDSAGPRRPGLTALRAYSSRLTAAWVMFLLGSAPALVAFGHAGGLAGHTQSAVIAVVLLNAGNLTGRVLAGPVADRTGHGPVLHLTALALIGVAVVLVSVEQTVAIQAALVVLGLQYGAVSVLVPMAVSDAVPAEQFGAAYGLVFTGWGVAGLAGPVLAGHGAQVAGYQTVAIAMGVTGLLFWVSILAWQRSTSPV